MVTNYKLSLKEFYFLCLTDINLLSVYLSLLTTDYPPGVNTSRQSHSH